MDTVVTRVPEQDCYEARVAGRHAGMLAYEDAGEEIVLLHTEVDDEFGGQGVGGALVRSALDDWRAEDRRVRVTCPFARGWIKRHPDYADFLDG